MPSVSNYSRQNTNDSCESAAKADTIGDTASSVIVDGPAYNGESNSPSNSLDRSLCGSLLSTDEVASCAAAEDFSASVADPDEQALLEKLNHANRFVMHC